MELKIQVLPNLPEKYITKVEKGETLIWIANWISSLGLFRRPLYQHCSVCLEIIAQFDIKLIVDIFILHQLSVVASSNKMGNFMLCTVCLSC